MPKQFTSIIKNGVPLTPKQLKAEIMNIANIETTKEYKKRYDILKLKLRSYEMLADVPIDERQSPQELFYKLVKWQARPDYVPSGKMKAILSAPAYNQATAKAYKQSLDKAVKSDEYITKGYAGTVLNNLMYDYAELYQTEPLVQEMFEKIKNPFRLKQALGDYADKLHEEQEKIGSRSFGYDMANSSFNIDAYLD